MACLLLLMPASAWAGEPLAMVTGPKTGTYYAIAKDIQTAAAKDKTSLMVKESEGSIDNIRRINSSENASLGIVQSDVLGFLQRSKNPDSERMASNVRIVFPLYNEEVHVFASKQIKDFRALHGKRVAVGEEGSGNMLTAINLFSMMGVSPAETIKISPEEGVVAVLRGELDAVIFVAGKPVRLFKNLEDLQSPEHAKYADMLGTMHFVPLDEPKMYEEYKPASITSEDYRFVSETVDTISVPAVLITYDFTSAKNKSRCKELTKLAGAVRKHIGDLKEHGHAKWKEVDLNAKTGIWKRDVCAWPPAPPEPKRSLNTDEFLYVPMERRRS